MKRSMLALALAVPLISASSTGVGRAQMAAHPSHLTVAALSSANTAFGLALFRSLVASHRRQNVFISPTSASLALEMAYDGARGATAAGMASALHLPPQSATVRSAAHALLTSLAASPAPNGVTIANSLWARSGTKLVPQFLQHARTAYSARAQTLDFNSPSAPVAINAWVKAATAEKIPSIVDTIPSSVILYLINAVYFHAQWAHPFPKASTHTASFSLANGSSSQVHMMSESRVLGYYKGPNYETVVLPYKGGRFFMNLVLPTAGTSLESIAQQATDRTVESWTAGVRTQFGSISLPRFSLNNDFQLAPSLSAMGLKSAFSDSANFSGMCTTPCHLSQVRQKTYLNVDENGTTAAAATSVGVSPTAVQVPAFNIVVDRPFLVSVTDATTGSTLFLGAIYSPS